MISSSSVAAPRSRSASAILAASVFSARSRRGNSVNQGAKKRRVKAMTGNPSHQAPIQRGSVSSKSTSRPGSTYRLRQAPPSRYPMAGPSSREAQMTPNCMGPSLLAELSSP